MFSNSNFPVALGPRFNEEDSNDSDDKSNPLDIDALLADESFISKLLESAQVKQRIFSVESERDKLSENNKNLLGNEHY
tara:strand:+ start:777 stop:1013 length:237 start_codon:yes stop_codon:yes gene_type:complete